MTRLTPRVNRLTIFFYKMGALRKNTENVPILGDLYTNKVAINNIFDLVINLSRKC